MGFFKDTWHQTQINESNQKRNIREGGHSNNCEHCYYVRLTNDSSYLYCHGWSTRVYANTICDEFIADIRIDQRTVANSLPNNSKYAMPDLPNPNSSSDSSNKKSSGSGGFFVFVIAVIVLVSLFGNGNDDNQQQSYSQPESTYTDSNSTYEEVNNTDKTETATETSSDTTSENASSETNYDSTDSQNELFEEVTLNDDQRNQLQGFMNNYALAWAETVNNDDYSYVSGYVGSGSELEGMHLESLNTIRGQGLWEQFESLEIDSVKANSDWSQLVIVTREIYSISDATGTYRKVFNWSYLISNVDELKIVKLETVSSPYIIEE